MKQIPFAFERPYLGDIGSPHVSKSFSNPVTLHRLKYCEVAYLVPQVSNGVQLTVASRLDLPHGHVSDLSDYLKCCEATKTNILHVKESRDLNAADHDDFFVQYITLQDNKEVRKWKKIFGKLAIELFSSFMGNQETGESQSNRQVLYADYGICSNRNTGRLEKDSPINGVPRPRLMEGTEDKVDLFVNFTKLLRKHCKWIWDMGAERKHHGCRRISSHNDIEALRVAMNLIWLDDLQDTSNYLCKFHLDTLNDEKFTRVPVVSGVVPIIPHKLVGRVAIIAYTRQSVGSFVQRVKTCGNAVEFVFDLYKKIELWRRSTDSLICHMKDHLKTGRTPMGTAYWSLETHANPLVYVSPWIHCISVLVDKYKLNIVEAVSLFKAAGHQVYSPYFFTVITEYRLRYGFPSRGVHIGFEFLKEMKEIEKDNKENNRTIPGLHFQVNREKEDPTKDEWASHVDTITKNFFYMWTAVDEDTKDAKASKRFEIYKNALTGITKNYDGVATLGGNHIMLVAAVIGLIPICFASEVLGPTPTLKKLGDAYGFSMGVQPKIQEYLSCLAHTMRNNGIHANRRIAENVTCKSLREMNTTNQFKDLYVAGTNLYEMISHNRIAIKMPHAPNENMILEKGLLVHFPYNSTWMTLPEIIESSKDVTHLRLLLEEESISGRLPKRRRNLMMNCIKYDQGASVVRK